MALRNEMEALRRPLTPVADAEKDLRTRERNSLVTLVVGMAMAFYGYDAKEMKSKAPSMIADDLARLGMSLNPKTIRKYIEEGAELLPGVRLE